MPELIDLEPPARPETGAVTKTSPTVSRKDQTTRSPIGVIASLITTWIAVRAGER